MEPMAYWTFATALFTAMTAGASWSAAEKMSKLTEVGALVQFAQAFASRDMAAAHDFLASYVQGWSDITATFAMHRNESRGGVPVANQHRRRISHDFQLIYDLLQVMGKGASDSFVRALVSEHQAEFYLRVIESLEAVVNEEYDRASFAQITKLHGIPRAA